MAFCLQSCEHTLHPTHCVWSMTAFLSTMLIAGHPIFMQALQPMHFALSTAIGPGCFTVLSNAHGRLEIMTVLVLFTPSFWKEN